MNSTGLLLLLLAGCCAVSARADLTIVQSVEGAGPATSMTIKIKGAKARIETSPQMSTIVDSQSGQILNLMNEQKQFLRISAAQASAAAAMALGPEDKKQSAAPAKLTRTGKTETIDGYEADEYITETPAFTGSYWISSKYPNAADIVKQMQALTPDAWGVTAKGMPDYRDFPGLPLRSRIKIGGQEMTTTLTSVKQDPLPESDFAPPAGFTEMKMPNLDTLLGGKAAAPKAAASPKH